MKDLHIKGIETSISIKAVTGNTNANCFAIDGLFDCSFKGPYNSSKLRKIFLPKTYSQRNLPVDINEIPTQTKIKKWDYLNKMHSFRPQEDEKIKIKILIGGNCLSPLEPVEVIPGRHGGPYTFRRNLGWCVTDSLE